VFKDEVPLSHFLNEELRKVWAISRSQFTEPSWNILRRALMKFDLGGVDYPIDYIEVEILEQPTLLDVKQVKHAGEKRIANLIRELSISPSHFLAKNEKIIKQGGKEKSPNFEIEPEPVPGFGVHDFFLTEILLNKQWRNEFFNQYNFHFEYSIFEDESIARELSMLESRVNGETLAEIGTRFGVTRERVRQVLEKAYSRVSMNPFFEGKTLSIFLEERKRSEHQMGVELIETKIRNFVNVNPGIKYEDLAEALALGLDTVKLHIGYQASKFVFQEQWSSAIDPEFSDEFIIGAIRMAAAIRSPLSAPMYENLVERGLVKGPKSQTIAKRFGTWSNACLHAGVMFVRSVRNEYSKTWNEEEILKYLIDFLRNKEFGVGVLEYDGWRSKYRTEAPSGPHIRNMFGSWIDAKNNALLYMKNNGQSCDLL
jgi:hypothetical protein